MPVWMSIVLGLAGGLAILAGAIYLAVRPYLRQDHKPWMVDHTDRGTQTYQATYTDASGGGGLG